METHMEAHSKSKNRISHDPTGLGLGVYPEQMTSACRKTPALLCLLLHHSQEPIFVDNLSVHQWMNKINVMYTHTWNIIQALKRKPCHLIERR